MEQMVPMTLIRPVNWRGRAEMMRMLADNTKDRRTRGIMLRIAVDYEKLANRAEECARVTATPEARKRSRARSAPVRVGRWAKEVNARG